MGEVATYRRGSFPQPYGKSEWYDGEDAKPFVQVADVTDAMNLAEDTKQKISKLAQPMSVFAEKNSVLVTLQGSIGRVAITQYGAFVDRTVLIFEKYKTKILFSRISRFSPSLTNWELFSEITKRIFKKFFTAFRGQKNPLSHHGDVIGAETKKAR